MKAETAISFQLLGTMDHFQGCYFGMKAVYWLEAAFNVPVVSWERLSVHAIVTPMCCIEYLTPQMPR